MHDAASSVSEYLPTLARACNLASVHNGGVLEPLYQLHAARLKLLLRPGTLDSTETLSCIAR